MLLLASLLLLSLWAKQKKKVRWRRCEGHPPDFDPDVGGGRSLFAGEEGGVTFEPAMRHQRLAAVRTLLADPRWKGRLRKVADLGCGEFAFAEVLKDLSEMEEYLAVDYLESQLREKLPRLSALADYLRRTKSHGHRSVLRVLAGSVAEPDDRLTGCDAVICVEVIEHLYPDVLECVPHTVFGCARPRVAIFSTPNSEFNFLFGDARKFRDSDHKFEWTREQFKCWALNIVSRYPQYSVEFYGVGRGPLGTTHVGCCTQLALFHRAPAADDCAVPDDKDARSGRPYVSVREFEVEPLPLPDKEEESLYAWANLRCEESSASGSDSWDAGWCDTGEDGSAMLVRGEECRDQAVVNSHEGNEGWSSDGEDGWNRQKVHEADEWDLSPRRSQYLSDNNDERAEGRYEAAPQDHPGESDDWSGTGRAEEEPGQEKGGEIDDTDSESEDWDDVFRNPILRWDVVPIKLRVDKAVQTEEEGQEAAEWWMEDHDQNVWQSLEEEELDRDIADVWL